MNKTNYNNYQLPEKMSLAEVDAYAELLASTFNNQQYKEWYCKVIHKLGIRRTREIAGRAEGSHYAGRLFSRLAKEEMSRIENHRRLAELKG